MNYEDLYRKLWEIEVKTHAKKLHVDSTGAHPRFLPHSSRNSARSNSWKGYEVDMTKAPLTKTGKTYNDLFLAGYSIAEVAKQMGRHYKTVQKFKHHYGLPRTA